MAPSRFPDIHDQLSHEGNQSVRHCANYDPLYIGCRECPGQVIIKTADGTVDTMCRAGEYSLRELLKERRPLPVVAEC